MNRLLLILLILLPLPVTSVVADDRTAVEYLKNLSLEQLPEVEVQLDDTFDLFDGLLRNRTLAAATGYEQSAHRSPAVATVITSQDIEAMGARTLDEALRAVPGLHVTYSYNGFTPHYVIRGMQSDANAELLILIDGRPIKKVEHGYAGDTWRHIPVQRIARIEVIRGPGSALHGADAVAGVINIINKKAGEIDGTEAGVRLGRFQTLEAWLLHGGTHDGVETALSLDGYRTDGPGGVVAEDLQTHYDQYLGTTASHAPGQVERRGEGVDLTLGLKRGSWSLGTEWQSRRDLGTGAGVIEALDPSGWWASDRLDITLGYANPGFSTHWGLEGRIDYGWTRQTAELHPLPPGAGGGWYPRGVQVFSDYSERSSGAELVGLYSGLPRHLIRVGGGLRYGEMSEVKFRTNHGIGVDGLPLDPGVVHDLTDTTASIYPEKGRRNSYLFAQDSWRLAEAWELTSGLRYDHYTGFGDTLNPRLSLVWQATPTLTGKLLYGRAFRAPSFAELYMENTTFFSNPDLKPETLDSYEIALDWRASERLHLTANAFAFEIKEKIVLDPVYIDGIGIADAYRNAGRWRGRGAEFELRWKLDPRTSLLFNYAWADTRDAIADTRVPYYPAHQGWLRLDRLIVPGWYLDLIVDWSADRYLPDPNDAVTPDSALFTDLTLRHKPGGDHQWSAALGLRNLFNRKARERWNVPLPERNLFLEVRYTF